MKMIVIMMMIMIVNSMETLFLFLNSRVVNLATYRQFTTGCLRLNYSKKKLKRNKNKTQNKTNKTNKFQIVLKGQVHGSAHAH